MKTDLAIKLFPDNTGFKLFLFLFLDDGAIGSIRCKTFSREFKAKDINSYTADWEQWAEASPEERGEAIRVRGKIKSEAPRS